MVVSTIGYAFGENGLNSPAAEVGPQGSTKTLRISSDRQLLLAVASTPLSDEVARMMVDRYGLQANPAEMVKLRCDDVASLASAVAQTDAIFLGVIAATRSGLGQMAAW